MRKVQLNIKDSIVLKDSIVPKDSIVKKIMYIQTRKSTPPGKYQGRGKPGGQKDSNVIIMI